MNIARTKQKASLWLMMLYLKTRKPRHRLRDAFRARRFMKRVKKPFA